MANLYRLLDLLKFVTLDLPEETLSVALALPMPCGYFWLSFVQFFVQAGLLAASAGAIAAAALNTEPSIAVARARAILRRRGMPEVWQRPRTVAWTSWRSFVPASAAPWPKVSSVNSVAQVVAVMGRGVVAPQTPLMLADDLGFTRGDGCFDALRVVVEGDTTRVDHLDRHLARFARSSAALELTAPDEIAWRRLIASALEAWKVPGEAVLKLVRTRGPEYLGGGLTELLTITPAPDASRARAGVTATTLDRGFASDAFGSAPWLLGGVKSLSYAVNVAAKREAARRGVDEAVFTSSDGFLLEGPTAGLLIAADDQLWTTPAAGTGVLESVTIAVIMDAASAEGVGTGEALLRAADLPGADGVWLVSAIRGVLPLLELDGVQLPNDPRLTRHLARTAGF